MEKEIESHHDDDYKPFQFMSAWFSSSVQPDIITKWREFGGHFETKERADYLFSENTYDKDTSNIYNTTTGIAIFKPNWIEDILELRKNPLDVPIAPYLLPPHFTLPPLVNEQTATPTQLTRRPLTLPRIRNVGGSVSLSKLNGNEELKINTVDTLTSETFDEVACDFESKKKQGIIHINSLGTICMRFIDVANAQNIVIKKKKSKSHTK